MWVGVKFYKTPDAFMSEARSMGISRRITAVPRDFVVGKTWVLIAHPNAITRAPRTEEEKAEARKLALAQQNLEVRSDADLPNIVVKGVISIVQPTKIEKIVTETQSRDTAEMEKLRARGIDPVIVGDDDPDHRGSAYDDDDGEDQSPLPFEGTGATGEEGRA